MMIIIIILLMFFIIFSLLVITVIIIIIIIKPFRDFNCSRFIIFFSRRVEAASAARSGPGGPGPVPVVRDPEEPGQERSLPVPAGGGGGPGKTRTTNRTTDQVEPGLKCRPAHPQLYSSSEPPLVRVSRGPVFSDITSCFRHFTHTVRLYHLDGKHI